MAVLVLVLHLQSSLPACHPLLHVRVLPACLCAALCPVPCSAPKAAGAPGAASAAAAAKKPAQVVHRVTVHRAVRRVHRAVERVKGECRALLCHSWVCACVLKLCRGVLMHVCVNESEQAGWIVHWCDLATAASVPISNHGVLNQCRAPCMNQAIVSGRAFDNNQHRRGRILDMAFALLQAWTCLLCSSAQSLERGFVFACSYGHGQCLHSSRFVCVCPYLHLTMASSFIAKHLIVALLSVWIPITTISIFNNCIVLASSCYMPDRGWLEHCS
jgi:hypothetical protein